MSVLFVSTPAARAQAPGSAATAPAGQPAAPAGSPNVAPAQGYPPAGPTGYPPAPPPAGYPPSYPAAGPPGSAPPRPGFVPVAGPIVQLVTNNPRARLQQEFQLRWTDVCAAPCGIPVNPAATYRVGGGSLRATDPFSMPRSSGTVLVDANMGSKVKRFVGIGLTIAGGVNLLAGGIYLIAAQNSTGNVGTTDVSKKDYFTVWGIGGLVLGAILTGIGIPLIIGGSSSAEVR